MKDSVPGEGGIRLGFIKKGFKRDTRCSCAKNQRYVEYISYFMGRTFESKGINSSFKKGDKVTQIIKGGGSLCYL